jgi:hypothetical protein
LGSGCPMLFPPSFDVPGTGDMGMHLADPHRPQTADHPRVPHTAGPGPAAPVEGVWS